jgi:hypothetical protein
VFCSRNVSGFEFLDQWGLHAAHEADFVRFREERGQSAYEIRALFLFILKGGKIWRNLRRGGKRVIDARKVFGGKIPGYARDVVGEDKADAENEADIRARRKLTQRCLAVSPLSRLDIFIFDAEFRFCALETAECRVVERLVTAPSNVEDESDLYLPRLSISAALSGASRGKRADGKKKNEM